MEHCLYKLAKRYPQLLMPIKKGIRESEEYKDIVLRGKESPYKLEFSFNPNDKFETFKTEVGEIEILSLRDRDDFIHAYRALGNRCEPVEVPDSTGATAIFGLNNWEKVRANNDNYKDSLILLSSGNYSNVTKDDVFEATSGKLSLNEEEWTNKSIEIRKYHEITHFIMRKKYPDNIVPVRDELIADIAGLIGAFNFFDKRLLKLFLGIDENGNYRKGGRLENYEGGEVSNIPSIIKQIDKFEVLAKEYDNVDDLYKNIERFL